MNTRQLMRKTLRFGLIPALALAANAWAAPTDIAQQPLALPAANVPPNIMLILDDSGSMVQQYTPDYLGRHFGGSNRLCLDSKDDNNTIDTNLDNCEAGDPPLMTPDLNTQYYNPEIRYFPAVNYDGTSKGSMNAANTDDWTQVPTDGVSSSSQNAFRVDTLDMNGGGSTVTTVDLAHNYPDRVWCKSQSDSASGSNCRANGTYTYPDNTYGYGRDTSGNIKFVYGAPYYYRIVPTVYCTNDTLIVCNRQSAPDATYPVPAPVRYCNSTALTNCQAKYNSSTGYTRPEYTGFVTTAATTAVPATATITVKNPQSDSYSGSITAVYVKGVNILASTVSAVGPINAGTAAVALRDAINNATGTTGYTATVSSNVVTVTAPGPGNINDCTAAQDCSTWNAASVIVQSPGTPIAQASLSFNITRTSSGDSIRSMSINGVALITSSIICQSSLGCTGSYGRNQWMADQLVAAINAAGSGYTAASSTNALVTITAPSGTGSEYNGYTLNTSTWGMRAGNGATLSGGITDGDIETSASSFSGGVDPNNGRQNVGDFVRTSITPYQDPPTNSIPNTFPKYPARTDCSGTTCSYAEEMTNFANWYAYYRTRDTMAKTAIGRAFVALTKQYRVGFITINPGSPVQSDRYLKVDDFTSGSGNQKDIWYQKLYGTGSNGSTPLREALSRVGRYYANVTSGINSGMDASPIQYSCQPNYAILMTDGYWNGSQGQDLSGNAVGNQDNVDAGYSTRAIGAYDGGLSGSTNTLADVAMYYYKTDLRTDLANNVPTTQKDTASFQHMTTFTVGLGLAGQLNFDPNYESETSGDFWDIKQGTKNWPVPVANSETALDDLWHAAVNGRGTFFSAKNPVDLANSLTSTINSLQSRVGAGAAAATSNLQPVAGDNFAFTAQYQTVDWTGDLEARTIDLSTGFVAYRALWSAQSQLDLRTAADRHIYTFDSTDNNAPTTGNGNQLKAFCWPGAYATGLYPACGPNEAELNSTEMGYFDPLSLPQAVTWLTDGSGRDTSASAQNLVDYLRGDTSNESTGGTATTDLYRNRVHLLGDIVDAQPAYVKAAPFGYDSGSYIGTDPYYQDFKSLTDGTTGTRKGTVFAAANDGMLHAFETDPDNNPYYQTAGISTTTTTDDAFTGTLDTNPVTGEGAERWAYIPSMVMPRLKDLASIPYSHEYYTDGSPAIGDVCFGHTTSTPCSSVSNWHTILVAGLNAGGRGYYALDVTDPNNPKALWELKGGGSTTCLTDAQANSGTYSEDCNIGYTFGNPIIAKRSTDGKWVVFLTSGYNNVMPGDGKGYLYVIDAQTGKILNRVSTGVGCDGSSTTAPCSSGTIDPSGLSRINAWVDASYYNNTAQRIYGGDLKGNVWRFQYDTSSGTPVLTATRITTLTDPSGTPQPITTRPELGLINNQPVVYVATGKLLGTTDTTTTQVQSIYAFVDDLTSTPITIRGNSAYVQQTLTASGPDTRTATSNAVDWSTQKGWYVDLPDSGERVNVDPVLQLGTLIVPSNVPSSDTCTAGGYGWINFLDYKTGSYVTGATADMTSTKIGASLVVGVNVVQLPGGAVKTIVTTADNQQLTQETPVSPPAITGRRVSWRELVVQ